MSPQKNTSITISLIVLTIATIGLSDYRDDSKAIKISGGEDYSLVLTTNKWLWASGDNYWYQLGIGDTTDDQFTPVRVHDGDMGTTSNYIEDINDFDAGWMHSLAVDIYGFVWSWGDNGFGQLGNNGYLPYQIEPIKVHAGAMPGGTYLHDIIAVGAGRSGAHSLAVDVDNLVWTWGDKNKFVNKDFLLEIVL